MKISGVLDEAWEAVAAYKKLHQGEQPNNVMVPIWAKPTFCAEYIAYGAPPEEPFVVAGAKVLFYGGDAVVAMRGEK